MKFSIFYNLKKKLCILHGQVFVMGMCAIRKKFPTPKTEVGKQLVCVLQTSTFQLVMITNGGDPIVFYIYGEMELTTTNNVRVSKYRDQPWFSVFKYSTDHSEGV